MEIVFSLVFFFIVLYLIYSLSQKPKWQRVYEDLEYMVNGGETFAYMEDFLCDKYDLTPTEARLCVNNNGNLAWFEMQSFLED